MWRLVFQVVPLPRLGCRGADQWHRNTAYANISKMAATSILAESGPVLSVPVHHDASQLIGVAMGVSVCRDDRAPVSPPRF